MKPSAPTFGGRQHTARSLALQILLQCREQDAFIQEILDRQLSRTELSPADRRLTTQLAYGALRRRGIQVAPAAPMDGR